MSTVQTPRAGAPDPDQPREAGAGEAAEATAATRTCPRCGAGLTPEQDWCLSCGTAVTTRVERPPSWKLPLAAIAAVLVLGTGALLAAFLGLADGDRQVVARAEATPAPTPAATPAATPTPESGLAPAPTAEPGGTGEGATEPGALDDGTADDGTTDDGTTDGGTAGDGTTGDGTTGDGTTDGATTDGTTGAAPASGEFSDWPAGEEAWTVILFSGTTQAEAESRARELARDGTTVGILDSDEYASLRAGYYVVFSGQYESQEQAEAAAEAFTGDADGAYPRLVEPR